MSTRLPLTPCSGNHCEHLPGQTHVVEWENGQQDLVPVLCHNTADDETGVRLGQPMGEVKIRTENGNFTINVGRISPSTFGVTAGTLSEGDFPDSFLVHGTVDDAREAWLDKLAEFLSPVTGAPLEADWSTITQAAGTLDFDDVQVVITKPWTPNTETEVDIVTGHD